MSNYLNHPQHEMMRELQRQHDENRRIAEAFNRGKTAGAEEERARVASQKLLSPPAPSHQQITNDILRLMHATLQRIEQGLLPMKLKGIAVKGVRKTKDGKITRTDKAPPHARQARRRKKNTVTGVRAAR